MRNYQFMKNLRLLNKNYIIFTTYRFVNLVLQAMSTFSVFNRRKESVGGIVKANRVNSNHLL